MAQITNKIKLSGLFFTVLIASMVFTSCGQKPTEGTQTVPSDSAAIEQNMAPDSLSKDSLPIEDKSSSTRPEPRKTK